MSVAIPVYNGERYLAESLSSVESQTVQPTERLVFDNCSTDNTRTLVAAAWGDNAVRRSPRNIGAVGNFNRAVRESTGTYFAWLAADDRLAPEFIERTLTALKAHPEMPACLPIIQFIDPHGHKIGEQRDALLGSPQPRIRLRSFLRRPRWTETYCMYRREVLLASPLFQDEWGADVLLTWWFLLRGPLLVLDDPLYEYRTYPVKSVDEVAAGSNPNAPQRQWRMLGLWRSLWKMTHAYDVGRPTARVARRELVKCLVHRHWMKHLAWDVWVLMSYLIAKLSPLKPSKPATPTTDH